MASEQIWDEYMEHHYDKAIETLYPKVRLREQTVAAMGLGGEEVVLDVGCGTGLLLKQLADGGHSGQLLGVDRSRGALRAAKRNVGDLDHIEIFSGDLNTAWQPIDYQPDVVVAVNVFYELMEPTRWLDDYIAILPSGGKLVLVNTKSQDFNPVIAEHMRWLHQEASLAEQAADALLLPHRLAALKINLEIVSHDCNFWSPGKLAAELALRGLVIIYRDDHVYADIDCLFVAQVP